MKEYKKNMIPKPLFDSDSSYQAFCYGILKINEINSLINEGKTFSFNNTIIDKPILLEIYKDNLFLGFIKNKEKINIFPMNESLIKNKWLLYFNRQEISDIINSISLNKD